MPRRESVMIKLVRVAAHKERNVVTKMTSVNNWLTSTRKLLWDTK